ncbi:Cysteine-rich secretory protein family protein [compost metagenome]
MIRTFFPVLIALFLSTNGYSQLTSENYWQLKSELTGLINKLRAEKQLKPLASDRTLEQAAVMHSNYMALNRLLKHEEVDPKKLSPKARVNFCGGKDFELVGENIIQSAPQSFPLTKEKVSVLAKDLFESWRKSPGHYSNMIHKRYELGELAFAVDSVNGVIYSTHVFGRKGTVIPHQLSPNGFGLKLANPNCADKFDGYMNLVYNLGNCVTFSDSEVWLNVSDKRMFNTIFSNPKDGLAIDLIDWNQLKCGKEPNLDMSPVYDGVLMRPLFRDELLKSNVAKSDYRVVIKLADIPAEMQSKKLAPSIMLLKDGDVCLYITGADLEKGNLNLVAATPKILEPENVKLEHRGIVKSLTVDYDFAPKDSVPKSYPSLSSAGRKVHSVYIQSYSSVDGDSLSNAWFHYMRAKKIREHVSSKLHVDESLIQMDYQENWELMDYQMRYYLLDNLLNLKHKDIRIRYKDHPEIPWQKLFAQQRRSCATINFEADLPLNTPENVLAETNLRTALINKDWNLANKAMGILYKQGKIPGFVFEIPFYDILKATPELTQNTAALFTLLPDPNRQEVNLFLMACLNRTSTLTNDARENLLILYAMISCEKLKVWDLPAKQLAKIIEPMKIVAMTHNHIFSPEATVNMHLTFINYFGQINDSKNISKSFDYIATYFGKKVLSVEDNLRLVKFFNNWSRYDLTIDRLKPLFKEKKLNKAGIFILAKTCLFYKKGSDPNFTLETLKAASVHKKEWCAWLKEDFQLLRDREIRDLYCKTCGY